MLPGLPDPARTVLLPNRDAGWSCPAVARHPGMSPCTLRHRVEMAIPSPAEYRSRPAFARREAFPGWTAPFAPRPMTAGAPEQNRGAN